MKKSRNYDKKVGIRNDSHFVKKIYSFIVLGKFFLIKKSSVENNHVLVKVYSKKSSLCIYLIVALQIKKF